MEAFGLYGKQGGEKFAIPTAKVQDPGRGIPAAFQMLKE